MKQSGEVPRAAGFHLTYPSLFSLGCKTRSNAVTVLRVNRRRIINDRSKLEEQPRPFCQASTDHADGICKMATSILEAESNSQEAKEEDVIAMVPLRLWRGRIYVYMYKNAFAEL